MIEYGTQDNPTVERTPGGTEIRRWEETLECGCIARFVSKDREGMVSDSRNIIAPCVEHSA